MDDKTAVPSVMTHTRVSRAVLSTGPAAMAMILVDALEASNLVLAPVADLPPVVTSLDTTTVAAPVYDTIANVLDGDGKQPIASGAASDSYLPDNPLDLLVHGPDEGNDTIVRDYDTIATAAFGGGADSALRSGGSALGSGAGLAGIIGAVNGALPEVSSLVFNGNSASFNVNIGGLVDNLTTTTSAVTHVLSHIQADLIVSGLDAPLFAMSPPGDPNRLFVLEKDTGRVVIVDLTTNQVLPQAFYDVPTAEMTNNGGERGLLGLAFHPGYATNGKFYLDLNNENGDIEIWELTRSANPDLADPLSQRTLLTVFRDPANLNHNGGWIGFGPDGLLYISVGDGGSGNDPPNNAQNINDLRGKILRIDVNGDDFPADPGRNYAIPPNNPFVGTNGSDEVFAYGLRNPWRASFDSATGDLYIADVGQAAREELNFLGAGTGAGTNFGWRVMEGNLPTGLPQLGNPPPGDPSLRAPILDYGRGLGDFQGETIIGGYVYHGPGGAQGLYFFGDFISNHIWTVRVENGQARDFSQRDSQISTSGGTLDLIASFAVDGTGRLYAVGLDGEIFRLTPSDEVGAVGPQGGANSHDNFDEAALAVGILLGGTWLF